MEKQRLTLLENTNQTAIRIIELLANEERWYSIIEISKTLNVGERTVQRYIHQILEMVEEFNQETQMPMELEYEKYHGLFLRFEKGVNLTEFKRFIINQDDTMQIFQAIIYEEFISVTHYAMEYYLSESLIRKSLKKIKDFLESYNLSLSRKNFQIVGEEKQIRLVIYVLTWITYKGTIWPFEPLDEEKVYRTVDEVTGALEVNFSEVQRRQMAYLLAVNLIRLRKHHLVEMEDAWKDYIYVEKLIETVDILKEFILQYNVHVKGEISFYLLLIQVKMKMYESTQLKERILGFHKKKNSDIYQATVQLMTKFNEEIVRIPSELYDRFFVATFCAHLFCKLFKNISVDIDGHNILEHLDYLNLESKLRDLLENLYLETGNLIFLETEFLVQKYFLNFTAIKKMSHFEPEIKILLESDLPFYLKKVISDRISDYYRHTFNLSFINENEREKADIIMTNIPYLLNSKPEQSPSFYFFDTPLKTRDIVSLKDKFFEIENLKYDRAS